MKYVNSNNKLGSKDDFVSIKFETEEIEYFKDIFNFYKFETTTKKINKFISFIEFICEDSIKKRPGFWGSTVTHQKNELKKMKNKFSNAVDSLHKIRLGPGEGNKIWLKKEYSLSLIQELDGLSGNPDVVLRSISYAHKAKTNLIKLIDLIDSELETTHKRKRGQRMNPQKELDRAVFYTFKKHFNKIPQKNLFTELLQAIRQAAGFNKSEYIDQSINNLFSKH